MTTPFTITHSLGSPVSFGVYTIAPRSRGYAVTPSTTRGSAGVVRIDGDRYEIPSVITVRILMDQASLAASYNLAYDTITNANAATEISWYEGTQLVDGVTNASVEVEGVHVFLTLSFAPTKPELEP